MSSGPGIAGLRPPGAVPFDLDGTLVGDTCEDMAAAAAGVGTIVGLTHIRREGELRAAGATHVAPGLPAAGSPLGLPLAAPRGAA